MTDNERIEVLEKKCKQLQKQNVSLYQKLEQLEKLITSIGVFVDYVEV